MKVTVFGASKAQLSQDASEQARKLGSLLGEASHTVLTGGYTGTMEEVSRGANEAGGWVIGITCDEIEAYRPGGANEWVQEEIHCSTLRERILKLIEESDAAIALPGGIGTLTEVSLMWNHLLTGAIRPRPLILVGPGWKATFDRFFQAFDEYVSQNRRAWVTFAPTVEEAIQILNKQKVGGSGKE